MARSRRLRVRADSRGARAQQGDEAGRDHVLRRSEEPCLRAPHQLQRRRQRQRRGLPARDAPDGRRIPVQLARRPLAGAAAALAVRREGRARDDARGGQPRTSSTSTSDRRGAARSIRRQPRLLRDLRRHARRQLRPLELHGHRQPRRSSICAAASIRRSTTSTTPTRIARSTACRASCRSRIRTSRSSRRSRRTSRRPRFRRASTGGI